MQEPIARAFSKIHREDFVPPGMRDMAQFDQALPIAAGQSISQPYVVAFMLEKLDPKEGKKILDIGSGSGWTTALLASIVGEHGKIVGLEIIPKLAEFGERNVSKYNFIAKGIARILCADGNKGYKQEAPYDGILASASLAAKNLPLAWKEQLKVGGRIVAPIQNSIWVFTKKDATHFTEKEYPGFVFVPFVGA